MAKPGPAPEWLARQCASLRVSPADNDYAKGYNDALEDVEQGVNRRTTGASEGAGDMTDPQDEEIQVTSLVSSRTREGRVGIRLTNGHEWQMSTAETRDLAQNLLHAAEAADSDAMFYRFAKDKLGAEDNDAQLILLSFRSFRNGK